MPASLKAGIYGLEEFIIVNVLKWIFLIIGSIEVDGL
jgi:hypothetical protein